MSITTHCTGCRACEQICPQGCISMTTDHEGFDQARLDESCATSATSCNGCNLCRNTCPENAIIGTAGTNLPRNKPVKVYAVRYKDDERLFHSASGGAFLGLAKYVLSQGDCAGGTGGMVYGAAYDENLKVSHIGVTRDEDLIRLQSSKYVQSNTEKTFAEVREKLREGVLVLYSGTGCQIAGLLSFLQCRDYPNLITVDLICHGVPSPKLYADYLLWLSEKYDEEITHYNFRSKIRGWGLRYLAQTKTKTRYRGAMLDPYYRTFLAGSVYRECCYRCKYATAERVSDFTIGDYWGIAKEHPDFFSMKGVSCVLVNTAKGVETFAAVEKKGSSLATRNGFHCIESTFKQVARHNKNLIRPSLRPAERDAIYDGLSDCGLQCSRNRYFTEKLRLPFGIRSAGILLKAILHEVLPVRFIAFVKKLLRR